MIYVIILLFVAGLTFGAGGMSKWNQMVIDHKEAQRVAAEQKLADATAKGLKEAENKIIDMQAAYTAGEANAKIVERKIYVKGQDYVRTVTAYSNPVCRVDAAGVQLINDQIAAMHASAAASVLGISVPAAGADQGTKPVDGRSVPAVSGEPATAAGVPAEASKPSSAGEVPGSSVPRDQRPKPTPIN